MVASFELADHSEEVLAIELGIWGMQLIVDHVGFVLLDGEMA